MTRPVTAIIDGESLTGSGTPFTIVDPSNEEVIAEVPEAEEALVDRAIASARAAFDRGDWRRASVEQRQTVLRRCADAIDAHADEIADIECANTGIPYAQVRNGQVVRAAGNLRFFAD